MADVRAPSGQALAVPATPASAVDGPSGFDPSRIENTCMRCGERNPCWFAPNEVWNYVVGGPKAADDPGGFLCPNCFILLAEAVGLRGVWELRPERVAGPRKFTRTTEQNPDRREVARACVELIRASGRPMKVVELLAALEQSGVVIFGKNRRVVLNTMLWRSPEIIERTKAGYIPAAIATEARRAGTGNTDPVHEGAGLKGIAHD